MMNVPWLSVLVEADDGERYWLTDVSISSTQVSGVIDSAMPRHGERITVPVTAVRNASHVAQS